MEEFIIEVIVAAVSGAISAILTTKLYIQFINKKVSGKSMANDVTVTGDNNKTSGGNMNG